MRGRAPSSTNGSARPADTFTATATGYLKSDVTVTEIGATSDYDQRFLTLYGKITDPASGYFSPQGIPYHSLDGLDIAWYGGPIQPNGANKAAFRLHRALCAAGVASTFHPGRKVGDDPVGRRHADRE